MADGNLKVAAISGRKYENFSSNKIVALFKRDRIPIYKNNGKIYTYSYSTDDKKLKKKEEQKKAISGFYSAINNAFSDSTDKDLNVLYYVGHGLTSQKEDNGYGGIPVGFIPNSGTSSASNFERITYVQLLKTLNKYRGKFVVIIDACIAGSIIDAAKDTLSNSDLDRYVFLTSSSNQRVSWGPAISLFIDSALNSNFKKVDKNNDGCVSLTELYNYIVEKHKITYHIQNPLFYASNGKFFNNMPLFQFNYTKLSASSISLSKGSKQTLKTSINGPKSIKHKLKYSSSNSSVASVDSKGCVTGKSSGTAIISVCLTDSKGQECISTKSSCVVKVYETTGIKLNSSSISLYVKDSIYISASVSGKSSKVTWKSSNSSVATVDSNGKVTGVKAGTAKITASVGGKKAVCTVTVKKKTSTEVAAYKNFLKKESFTISYSYTVNGHKYTNKNQMVIASFSYVDTNEDRKPELYVRAYKKGDNPSYATDYLISYKNRKCVPVGLEEKLTGYFQGTNVKVSVSYAYMYNNPSTPYTKDTTYLYKTQRAYTTQQYLSSGSTVYRKFTTSYTAEMRTASEFYSWYRNYANNGRNYHSFVFYSNTASNLNKIIK